MMEVFEAFESELWPPSADTRRRPRLGRFLSWVLIFYSVGLELFRTCYAVIFRGSELVAKDRGDLLERLEGRLDHALLGFARAVGIRLLTNGKNELEEQGVACKITEALEDRNLPPKLVNWCARHPQEARVLLRVVTYAGYSTPDAARRALEMREAIEWAVHNGAIYVLELPGGDASGTSGESVSETLVEAALKDIMDEESFSERLFQATLEEVVG